MDDNDKNRWFPECLRLFVFFSQRAPNLFMSSLLQVHNSVWLPEAISCVIIFRQIIMALNKYTKFLPTKRKISKTYK